MSKKPTYFMVGIVVAHFGKRSESGPTNGDKTLKLPMDRVIQRAERLYRCHNDSILADPGLARLLARYQMAIQETRDVMQRISMVKTCGHCSAKAHGSCCFEGVEEWFDSILLLINLLMEAEIPKSREFDGHCLFVGRKGCKLLARHAFCLNYLCPGLKASLGPSLAALFLSTVGDELRCGIELEQSLVKWLSLQEGR